MLKNLFWTASGLIAGIVLTAGVASALAGSVHPSGAPAGHHVFDATTPGSPPADDGPGRLWRHDGVFGRVTAVKGDTITLSAWNKQSITVTVSSSTTYQTPGAAKASMSDVHIGSTIAVQGTSTGSTSYNATAITIVPPRADGTVTGVSGSSITIKSFDGSSQTILVDSSTKYQEAGQAASLHDVTTGARIDVEGTTTGGGQMRALVVQIQLPHVAGKVTAIAGSSFTISAVSDGDKVAGTTPTTVATSGTTKYLEPGNTTANASSVKVGSTIVAEGKLSAGGKTLQAQRIVILPAGVTGRGGFFGHGRFNGPPGQYFGLGGFFGHSRFIGPSGRWFGQDNGGGFFDHGSPGNFSPGGSSTAPATTPFSGSGSNA